MANKTFHARVLYSSRSLFLTDKSLESGLVIARLFASGERVPWTVRDPSSSALDNCRFDRPDDAVQENGAGRYGEAVGHPADGFTV